MFSLFVSDTESWSQELPYRTTETVLNKTTKGLKDGPKLTK